jgi:hypothetical protein
MLLNLFNATMVQSKFLGLIGSEGTRFIRAEVLNIEKNPSLGMIITLMALYMGFFLLLFATTKIAKPSKKTIGL